MTLYEILKAEANKNLIDVSKVLAYQTVILKAMRTYGRQEYMKGFEDGKTVTEHGTTMWQE